MYRKTIATAVAGLLILGLGACGNASDAKTADAGSTSQSQTTKKPAEKKPVEQPADLTGTWKQTNSGILLYLVVFRFGLTECLEIGKRWYFNAFAIL